MREFLRSGAFGPLKIGATREQVRAALGEPDDWSIPSRRQRLPAIWKYGVVELHFHPGTDTVYLIHADDFEHLHAGPVVDLGPWWMHPDATLEQARAELAAAHLRINTVDWRLDDRWTGVSMTAPFAWLSALGPSWCLRASYPRDFSLSPIRPCILTGSGAG